MLLDVARISHFFSKDKLTFAASGGRDHVVDFTLGQLEEQLDGRRFVRIHRATIVNIGFAQELDAWVDGGSWFGSRTNAGRSCRWPGPGP